MIDKFVSAEFVFGLLVGASFGGWAVFMFVMWLFPYDCTRQGHDFVADKDGLVCVHCKMRP